MKISSNQIIIILIAFMVGVAFTSLANRDADVDGMMENEATEESMEEDEKMEEEEVEEKKEEEAAPAPVATTTTTTTVAKPNTSNEFVSGACNTNLSGRKDSKLNAVILSWSPCASDDFQLYRLVKSSKNTTPTYPADPVAFTSSNKNAANFVDKTVAPRTTYYYRMCVVQRLGQMNCSNVATVSY